MDLLQHPSKAASRPDLPDYATGTGGWATEGVPGVAEPTTYPAYVFNDIQAGLRALIVTAGLTPTRGAAGDGQLVDAARILSRLNLRTVAVTASTTLTANATTRGSMLNCDATAGAIAVTLPAAATAGADFVVGIRKTDASANAVSVAALGNLTLSGQGATVLADSDGTSWRILSSYAVTTSSGDGSAVFTAGENITVNATTGCALVYVDVANERGGGAGRLYAVDADATGPVRLGPTIGLITANVAANGTASVVLAPGLVTGLSNLTAGGEVWAHPTAAGALTQTEPAIPADGTQSALVPLGLAISATSMWFQPPDTIEFVKHHDSLANNTDSNVALFADAGAADRAARAFLTAGGSSNVASGSNVGTYNGSGGVNAAFDGNASQTSAQGATCSTTQSGFVNTIGKSGLANLTITGVTVTAGSNNGFVNGASRSYVIQVSTDGGGNYSNVANGTSNGSAGEVLNHNFTPVANVTDVRFNIDGNGANSGTVAELTIRQSAPTRLEPITVQGATFATGSVVAVRHDDGTGNGSGNTTNFKNITGSAVNVTLHVRV